MRSFAAGAVKTLLLEILGWTVLTLGVLALFLPGPGLLLTFLGLAILSTQHAWARRILQPVRVKAWRGAVEGVETPLRICLSVLAALLAAAAGVLWIVGPPAPSWWPLRDDWWLFGGDAVGITLIASSILGLGLLAFAYQRFHGKPEAVRHVERMEARERVRARARREARRRLRALRTGRSSPRKEARHRATRPAGDGA